jgi:hypothetical protein
LAIRTGSGVGRRLRDRRHHRVLAPALAKQEQLCDDVEAVLASQHRHPDLLAAPARTMAGLTFVGEAQCIGRHVDRR